MGTRPGTLDPGVVLHLFQTANLSVMEVERMLYQESGLLGISGTSSDMRDLLGSSLPEARLAIDYFVYQAGRQIGALAAVLGGLDALVFTAGMENAQPRFGAGSARCRPGSVSPSIPRPMRPTGRAFRRMTAASASG
jgi:acetate kinase